jgi:hypothetical protein
MFLPVGCSDQFQLQQQINAVGPCQMSEELDQFFMLSYKKRSQHSVCC